MHHLDLRLYFIKGLLKCVIAEIKLSAYSFLISHQGESPCTLVVVFFLLLGCLYRDVLEGNL